QSYYYVEIDNAYLGKHRRVTGRTRREVELKAAEQLQRWSEQEARARDREAVANAKAQAAADTEAALDVIAQWQNVLNATLPIDDRLDWHAMLDRAPFALASPSADEISRRLGVPQRKPFVEWVRKSVRQKREAAEQKATALYEKAVAD